MLIWASSEDLMWTFSSFTVKLRTGNLQQSPQQNSIVPIIQECIDAITEHQRLHTLVKGEWGKGLLPQSSIRPDYTVQRIRGNFILMTIIQLFKPVVDLTALGFVQEEQMTYLINV